MEEGDDRFQYALITNEKKGDLEQICIRDRVLQNHLVSLETWKFKSFNKALSQIISLVVVVIAQYLALALNLTTRDYFLFFYMTTLTWTKVKSNVGREESAKLLYSWFIMRIEQLTLFTKPVGIYIMPYLIFM